MAYLECVNVDGIFYAACRGRNGFALASGCSRAWCFYRFFLSLRYGVGGLTKRDRITLIAAGATLLIWFFTKNPVIAVYLTIIIDALGAWLTVAKAYEHPESETMITWALSGIGGFFAIFAIQTLNFELLSYPLYIFVINFAVVVAMILGKRKKLLTS